MQLPRYDVTVFRDGSWHSGTAPFRSDPDAKEEDLRSLLEYLAEKWLARK